MSDDPGYLADDVSAEAHAFAELVDTARAVVRGWGSGTWRIGPEGDETVEALSEALGHLAERTDRP
jgi:hypothetical protein